MPQLKDIHGQQRAIAYLRKSLKSRRIHHAMLFSGPTSVGKQSTALAFAQAVNCETLQEDDGCGTCDSCRQIHEGRHPDIITLVPEGAAQIISIKTIRSQVIAPLATSPNRAKVRFFLIEEATALNGPAANALLKTLEEPPPRTTFILSSSSADQLLPTIRSRCQRVKFLPLSADLQATLAGEEEQAERLRHLADSIEGSLQKNDFPSLFSAAKACSEDRKEIPAVLRLVMARLHQKAIIAIKKNETHKARSLAAQIDHCKSAHIGISKHNNHGQLSLETLLWRARYIR